MPRRTKNTAAAELEIKIENNIANRIRLRRGLLGMSQSDLARALGITFQQVQKYERGSNRVSVGKMYRLADILDVPLSFFFDGLEDSTGLAAPATGFQGADHDSASPTLSRRDLDLLRAWRQAPPDVADAVASLLRAVSNDDALGGESGTTPTESAATTRRQPAQVNPVDSTPALDGAPPRPARRRRGAVWDPADMARAGGKSKA